MEALLREDTVMRKICSIYTDSASNAHTKIIKLLELQAAMQLKQDFIATEFLNVIASSSLPWQFKYSQYRETILLLECCYEDNEWDYVRFVGKKILVNCISQIPLECTKDFADRTNCRNLKKLLTLYIKPRKRNYDVSIRKDWVVYGVLFFGLLFAILFFLPIFYHYTHSKFYLQLHITAVICTLIITAICVVILCIGNSISPLEEYDRDLLNGIK